MRRERKHSVYVDRYVTKNKLKKNYEFPFECVVYYVNEDIECIFFSRK